MTRPEKPSHTTPFYLLPYRATVNSLKGFKAAFKYEWAFRLEVLILLFQLPCIFIFWESLLERALLLIVTILLPLCELINSGIEAAIDRIGPEYHELSGRAKDLGSAVVLTGWLLWLVVWSLFLWDLYEKSVAQGMAG